MVYCQKCCACLHIHGKNLLFDPIITKKGALMLRALNNPTRQTIKFIQARQPTKVTDIYKKLKIEQSVASQQLAILREGRFVNTERDGT
jgi:DNA-binding transcriptional ArsR family regulator